MTIIFNTVLILMVISLTMIAIEEFSDLFKYLFIRRFMSINNYYYFVIKGDKYNPTERYFKKDIDSPQINLDQLMKMSLSEIKQKYGE